ncbi:MAG: hypothetical protein AB7V04_07745 [Desulfomonilaceae bacterium]
MADQSRQVIKSSGVSGSVATRFVILIGMVVPQNRLGLAFGLFNTAFGVAWFLGSLAMGILYDVSITYLIIFSVGIQLLAIPVIMICSKHRS